MTLFFREQKGRRFLMKLTAKSRSNIIPRCKGLAKEFRGTIITVLKVDEQGSTFLDINIDSYCEWIPRPEVVRDIKIFIRGFNASTEIKR